MDDDDPFVGFVMLGRVTGLLLGGFVVPGLEVGLAVGGGGGGAETV